MLAVQPTGKEHITEEGRGRQIGPFEAAAQSCMFSITNDWANSGFTAAHVAHLFAVCAFCLESALQLHHLLRQPPAQVLSSLCLLVGSFQLRRC